ncbi:unnamed protein product [Merluccius merluccius]
MTEVSGSLEEVKEVSLPNISSPALPGYLTAHCRKTAACFRKTAEADGFHTSVLSPPFRQEWDPKGNFLECFGCFLVYHNFGQHSHCGENELLNN